MSESHRNIFSHKIIDFFHRGKEAFKSFLLLAKEHPIKSSMIGATILLFFLLKRYYHSFLYHPDAGFGRHCASNPRGYRSPQDRSIKFLPLPIETSDNLCLQGWYLEHPKTDRLILYFHENAGSILIYYADIGSRLPFLQHMYHQLKSDVMIVAYRGFSDSADARITQNGIQKDAVAIMDTAIQMAQARKLRLYVFGRSLGGAVGIYAAGLPQFKDKVSGLILENTFTSIFDVAYSIIPLPITIVFFPFIYGILRSSWQSLSRLKDVSAPILMIKGCKDQLVPKAQMDRLQQECIRLKHDCFSYEIKEGTHNQMWVMEPQVYWKKLLDYFSLVEGKGHL